MGVSRNKSSQWQALAVLPDKEFERKFWRKIAAGL
jgi:hypothetical protein